ncbi:MAG: ribosome-binding ATPase [Candidatus Cloacimonadota bacterium]|nr:ribosome-binding ATPase [Candidatus Cloacimonadota bacterium]
MKIALIGPPKSGKTTIFNALTGADHEVDKYSPPATEANIGIVQVTDERITRLSELYQPKKTIYANLEFHDFPGIFARETENPESTIFSEIKSCDAFVLILRAFKDEELDQLYQDTDPLKVLSHFEEEMILADLMVAEKRLEKIALSYKRGVKTPALMIEEKALQRIVSHLQDNNSIRSLELPDEEEKAVRGFQLMSAKALLILLNTTEKEFKQQDELLSRFRQQGYMAEVIAGKFEQELAALEADEAKLFMADMGMDMSIKDRLSMLCYELLGLISFFTVGPDEVRAWTITKGTTAINAAGKIHSDLARGFIRAECFSYEDLIAHGSEKHLKEKGLFRLEGKEYLVQDGDILNIRFNV